MKISFCELLMLGTFGMIIVVLVAAFFPTHIAPMLNKLKENWSGRIGMLTALVVTCCMIGLFANHIRRDGGLQLVSCTQKEQSAVTAALATVSLPCPCGCGKHLSN